MRYTILIIGLLLIVWSCKTQAINQKINKKREGLWIEKYTLDSSHYESIGKYRRDDPVKKWRYYLNGKIIKKEKHKRNTSITKFYHKNGKLQSKGKSKLETGGKNLHWFYYGDWKFYDEERKLIRISKYENGKLISVEKLN